MTWTFLDCRCRVGHRRPSDARARLALVAAGVGISLVTYGTSQAINRRGVVYRRLVDPPTSSVVVVHRGSPEPAIRTFVKACRSAVDRLDTEPDS